MRGEERETETGRETERDGTHPIRYSVMPISASLNPTQGNSKYQVYLLVFRSYKASRGQ